MAISVLVIGTQTSQESGFDFDTYGITLGADYRFSDEFVLGGAIGYATTDVEIDANGGDLDSDGYTFSLYGLYQSQNDWYADAIISYGLSDYDQQRNIDYTVAGNRTLGSLLSDTDGDQFSVGLGAGYDVDLAEGLLINLFGRANYTRTEIDSFSERAEGNAVLGLNMTIDDQEYESLTTTLGARVSKSISMNWGVLTPQLGFEYEHEYDGEGTVRGQFVVQPDPNNPDVYEFEIGRPDRNYFRLNLGVSAVFAGGVQSFISYDKRLWRRSG